MSHFSKVETKFGNCVKTIIKGVAIGSNRSNFFRAFESCIENLMKTGNTGLKKSKVMKGKNVVGVDPDVYDPVMTKDSREVQEGIKEHLKNLKALGTDEHNWPEIVNNLKETYELQRTDILLGTSEILGGGAGRSSEDDDELLNEKAFEKLKREWPFLFEMVGLELHHNTLTKRELGVKIKSFVEEHLRFTLYFLTSSSNCNVENVIQCLLLKKRPDILDPERKFLLMLNMLANHFRENFSSLYIPAEVSHEVKSANN